MKQIYHKGKNIKLTSTGYDHGELSSWGILIYGTLIALK